MHGQIVSLDWSDLHDIPYVQGSHPLTLIEEAKDVSHVQELVKANFLLFKLLFRFGGLHRTCFDVIFINIDPFKVGILIIHGS